MNPRLPAPKAYRKNLRVSSPFYAQIGPVLDRKIKRFSAKHVRKFPHKNHKNRRAGYNRLALERHKVSSKQIASNLTEDLDSAIEAFMNVSRAKGLTPQSLSYYSERLKAFKKYTDMKSPGIKPKDVTPAFIRQFILNTLKIDSAATANHNRALVFRLFQFLLEEKLIPENPAASVKKLKEPRPVIETFTEEQINSLLATCDTSTFVGLRDKALFLTLYDSGLRITEALTLSLSDVDWTQQIFKVMGKGQQGRFVPFGLEVRRILTRYLAHREGIEGADNLFITCYGEKMKRGSVLDIVKRRAKKAHISGVRASPHTFRHTFAVQYLRNGGDVFSLQRILGHSSLTMTRRYVDFCQEDIIKTHRKASPADNLGYKEKTGRTRIR
ncbi:MAG: tyrosine-type recombinase/integrase [Armatimonadota bacterium]